MILWHQIGGQFPMINGSQVHVCTSYCGLNTRVTRCPGPLYISTGLYSNIWYLWYWGDKPLLVIGSGAVRRQVDRRLGIIFTHAWHPHSLLPYFSFSVLIPSVIWPTTLMQSSGVSRAQFPYPEQLDQQTSPERPSGSGSVNTSMASQQSGRSSSASSRSQSSKNQVRI